jgi:hypothetical protein
MIFEVIVRSFAEKDIRKSFDWYEFQRLNLGNEFLDEVSKGVSVIKSNPFVFQIRYKETRIGYINKFPFGIHYIVEKNKVIILGVFHFKLSNSKWMNRK